jgi:mannose-6-phosphate isomerase-like protein (cupin superfamily)
MAGLLSPAAADKYLEVFMRRIIVSLAFTFVATFAMAKQPAQPATPQSAPKPTKTFTSAADVTALIAKSKSERKDGQSTVTQPMLELGSYDGHLEYRASVGAAAVHEKEAEIFYVIDGSATLITGGKLVKETRTNPTNLGGTGIEGGDSRTIAKGDFILVPEGTPHWFSTIDGVLVLFSVHIPRP